MNKEVYDKLTQEQKYVLKEFTKYRTATLFEVEAAKIYKSPELMPDWIYSGYVDTGFFGGGKCSMGHTLRYEHHATNKRTNEEVIFGVKCVSDFFNITPGQLKMIKNGVVIINRQVEEIIDKLERFYSFTQYDNEKRMTSKVNSLFEKTKHHDQIVKLLSNQLPLPNEFEYEISNAYYRETVGRDYHEFLSSKPLLKDLVAKAQSMDEDIEFKTKHPNVWAKLHNMVMFLKKYKKISDPQLELFKKLTITDYHLIDGMVDDLRLLHKDNFNSYEIDTIKSILAQYEDFGMTPGQLSVLQKVYDKYKDGIDSIKEHRYQKAEG